MSKVRSKEKKPRTNQKNKNTVINNEKKKDVLGQTPSDAE
jgi:hypothetical protein